MFKIMAGEYGDIRPVDVPEFENRVDAEMFVKIYNMDRASQDCAWIDTLATFDEETTNMIKALDNGQKLIPTFNGYEAADMRNAGNISRSY